MNHPLNERQHLIDRATTFGNLFKYVFCTEFPNGDGRYKMIKYIDSITNAIHLYFVLFILCFKIDISIFVLLFRSALNQFLKIILNATLPIINHYNTNTGKMNIEASVSNNNEPLPLAFIGHECMQPIICNSYRSANPNPQTKDPPSTSEFLALSAFLQTCTWPLCVLNDKCEKPTIVHRPDVCIVYKEVNNALPAGRNMFHIPIFICEVEGSKSVWGEGEQESKAIEEACYVSFIPENYIIFIYARRFEFLACKCNPYMG